MLEHGGHLISASEQYDIPVQQWIDLSTGINPNGWPVPLIPAEYWQRLPEENDPLIQAAQHYYQCQSILPVAGSQAAIQLLPLLRNKSKVAVLSPAYAEHAYHWKKAGHEIIEITSNIEENISANIHQFDVLIIINPNNPTGRLFSKEQLLSWHKALAQRGGWLIIDEAFIDSTPENSLSSHPACNGLIILRSIGKFFGLAGIRCGFIIAPEALLNKMNGQLGPWTISNPSRYIASAALQDIDWQKETQRNLQYESDRLTALLSDHHFYPDGKTNLFQWIKSKKAQQIHQQLAQKGILTRLFKQPFSLRFGLPKNDQQWHYLQQSFTQINFK